jgi:hypothetical protein
MLEFAMSDLALVDRIERAFAHREKPRVVVVLQNPAAGDDEDALWFAGRDWRNISLRDWNDYPSACFRFTPEAYRYYLPSALSHVAKSPDEQLPAADWLLGMLDRSPNINWWDPFLLDRLLGLESEEYDVIKDWLLMLSGRRNFNEDALTRAYETVDLLQRETGKVRRLAQP